LLNFVRAITAILFPELQKSFFLEKTEDFLMFRTGGTYSNHSAFKCQGVKVKKNSRPVRDWSMKFSGYKAYVGRKLKWNCNDISHPSEF
jgi:hypothetical protein